MKRAHGHQNIAPSGDRLSPYTVMLLKLLIVSIFFLLIAGCDRYDKKPICSSTIDKNDLGTFSLGASGTAFDWKTKTVWYRCPGGSYFSVNTCSGDSLKLSWDDAAGYAQELSEVSGLQWRLATLSEVKSIIASGAIGSLIHISSRRLNWGIYQTKTDPLLSLATHDISIVIDLAGEVSAVNQAEAWNYSNNAQNAQSRYR